MIMKAENIDINSTKNGKRLINKQIQEIRRDCIKMEWRQDWDMNETL